MIKLSGFPIGVCVLDPEVLTLFPATIQGRRWSLRWRRTSAGCSLPSESAGMQGVWVGLGRAVRAAGDQTTVRQERMEGGQLTIMPETQVLGAGHFTRGKERS